MFLRTLILALLLFFPLQSLAANQAPQPNIDLQEAFYYLQKKGAIPSSYEKTDLDSSVTRQEFLKILLLSLDFQPSNNQKSLCADIAAQSEFVPYFNQAISLHALNPRPPQNKCYPLSKITKKTALQIIFVLGGIPIPKISNFAQKPADIRASSWFSPLINRALELNLINLDSTNKIHPNRNLSYRETVELIYRTLIYLHPSIRQEVNFDEFQKNLQNSPIDIPGIQIPNIEILLDVLNKLSRDYYYKENDKLTPDNIVYKTIDILTKNLSDPYTRFQDPTSTMLQDILGEDFEGIGIQIQESNQQIIISNVIKNSPAEAAGLQAHDILTKVAGASTSGLSLEDLAKKIRGPKGTTVNITISRPATNQELNFEVTRAKIQVSHLDFKMLDNNIGLIEINIFGPNIDQEFDQAIAELKKQGVKKLLIDVRSNPGGYYDAVINILSHFLKKDQIIAHLQLLDQKIPQYSNGRGELQEFPLVVLVNESSASASEIFAAAIQENQLGTLVGTKTFGKGSVQELNIYDNQALFKVTVAKWLTPKEKQIDGTGITPDIIIANPDAKTDLQFEKALEILLTK